MPQREGGETGGEDDRPVRRHVEALPPDRQPVHLPTVEMGDQRRDLRRVDRNAVDFPGWHDG